MKMQQLMPDNQQPKSSEEKCRFRHWVLIVCCWAFCFCVGLSPVMAQQPSSSIPEPGIAALQEELDQGVRGATSVDVRRACKSVVRGAQSLLEKAPEAESRYRVLSIMFEGQKRLLSLEPSEENRNAIFDTCRRLLDAPDEYAEARLEADMLLMDKELSEKNALVDERVKALEKMIAKYRGTPAEWKSLTVGSFVATKLLALDLDDQIRCTMLERFAGDHKVTEYRRNSKITGQTDAVFSGRYEAADGRSIVFPNDRWGHNYLVCFWSQETPKIDDYLLEVKGEQDKYQGRLEVYSFNVDELPDAGEKQLRKLGLDWMALRLPGGRKSLVYRAYAQRDPEAIFVNAQGHVLLVSYPEKTSFTAEDRARQGELGGRNLSDIAKAVDDERYLAQLQYLFIGDYLVEDSVKINDIPEDELRGIQECFTPPPFRYRLGRDESLANYQKAEKICASAIKKYPNAPDLWMVRNRRIIALIGMWNLALEPKHLQAAVEEAKAALATNPPTGADIVPRFCLAKEALRSGESDPEAILSKFIVDSGGNTAAAFATAAELALEANARTMQEKYRKQLLGTGDEDPALWPVCAFLRDKHHCYRNFWASPGGYSFGREQKYKFRDMVSGLGDPMDTGRRLKVEFEKLDGGKFRIPEDASGKMLGIIFAEPSAAAPDQSNMMELAKGFAEIYAERGVDAVMAFISEDTNTVKSLVTNAGTNFHAALLPGGLKNPLVQQLGILSADRIPNPLLLRPDGTIAWAISGLEYCAFGERPEYAIGLAIGSNIEKIRSDAAFDALEKGDFTKALQLFKEFTPWHAKEDWWLADRLHGRALAYMGLREWKTALTEIDAAINQRRDDFKSAMCKCHGVVEMLLTKATILEKLGRGQEAKLERSRAVAESLPHSKLPPGEARLGVPVGVYYDWLKQIRLTLEKEK